MLLVRHQWLILALLHQPLYLTLDHMFRFLQQYIWVEPMVVVIIELHDTAHEGMLCVLRLKYAIILVLLNRHHHRLLNEVGCVDHRVSVQLLERLDLLNAL